MVLSPCWGRVWPAATTVSRSMLPWCLYSQALRLAHIPRQLIPRCVCTQQLLTSAANSMAGGHQSLRMRGLMKHLIRGGRTAGNCADADSAQAISISAHMHCLR